MTSLPLRLNPALSPESFAEAYARDGFVQVHELFEPAVADELATMLETFMAWELIFSDEHGGGQGLSADQLRALGPERLRKQIEGVVTRARENFAYWYFRYPMIGAYIGGRDPGHPIHRVSEFINSDEFLEFGRAVTGETAVNKADGQATMFRSGHFLNLHDDTGVGERRAAYTLGFTRRWRADWGGQLLFHDAAGDVTRGFGPRFNVLTLFRAPQWHSVAPVAAYAGAPRISIAGWLRDDPKPA
jgi:SM-20-related protein